MGDDQKNEDEPRELLDLDVKEVSLVDRAANKRKFIVIKKEDQDMGNFKTEQDTVDVEKAKKQEDEEKAAKAKADEEAKEAIKKAEDLKGAIAKVLPLLEKMAAESGAPTADIKMVADHLKKVAAGGYPSPQSMKKAEDEEDKKKADVQKGRKQITEARLKAMEDCTIKLISLVSDVDEGASKRVLAKLKGEDEEEAKKAADEEKEEKRKAAEKEEEQKAKVKKDLGEAVTKALEPLATQVKELSETVEKIETARGPSKQSAKDGTTEVKKQEGGLFANVI